MAHMDNQDYKIEARAFKRCRVERDLTLEKMAQMLSIHPSTVYRIENGITEPHERIAARILRVFPELGRTA